MTNLTDWLLNDGGSKTASAFNFTFNTPLKYYEWIEQPGNEHRLVRFGHAMHGTKQFEIAENIIHGKLSSHVIPPLFHSGYPDVCDLPAIRRGSVKTNSLTMRAL